jgi:hypothetical protein
MIFTYFKLYILERICCWMPFVTLNQLFECVVIRSNVKNIVELAELTACASVVFTRFI